ncbi:PDR/VanB family oxidoreductase [Paracoccus shanxieyensis]|uniref:2Fe-2S iron-sulfur cluster binding domain-containing protein n=1 Tax=Paracoccus shanxieyensis TaxID=2675752 RepID=A0A6L6J0X8_9RHOB|nr:PDR/VanB family oxidoreductase [Paracoccus shanxieyensis]MTH65478.1 2Fe-2S iron-sulfur cluster binding domain-containing protein [Paracoccus shanxieyensis]MTH88726.1 2Fe-2S iron-sulfur cluster binding domain-containing protein [Paracoccus shanxieyensis]
MIPLLLTEKTPLSPRITRFRFQHPDGAALPVFSGGAHVIVEMQDGDTLRRNAYSLVSDPQDGSGYEIAVQREDQGRGGSRFMHEQAQPGMTMRLGQPVNLFGLNLTARKHLLIAGGVGITPFLAQIADLDRLGAEYELHYALRARSELAADLPGAHLHVSDEGSRMDLAAILADQPLGTHLYVCGSARMIDSVLQAAIALGWPRDALHSEEFLAPAPGAPFAVHCAASDQTLTVGPHQSLLEAMEAAGIDAPWLCRGGACGQCETDVLACDGQIDHRDHWLEPGEQARKIMPCVSRFKGALLTIDR